MLARAAPRAPEATSPLTPETPPANDDRAAAGRSSRRCDSTAEPGADRRRRGSFRVWLALCGFYGYRAYDGPAREALLRPEIALFVLAALGPIIFLFAFAALSRRLQELRLSASSIAQVAMRLAEPEATASEQFVTLSQAIRREVTSMGDGVERAYARATELETLVRAEVTSLERSSGENERRLRSLIAEMADQREAILANGGQLRATIADRIRASPATSKGSAAVGITSSRSVDDVATSLGASSEEIAITMDRTGTTTVDRIAAQGDQPTKSFGIGAEVAERLAGSTDESTPDLLARVADIDSGVKATSRSLIAEIDARSQEMAGGIGPPPPARSTCCAPKASPWRFNWRPPRRRRAEALTRTAATSPAGSTPAVRARSRRSCATASPAAGRLVESSGALARQFDETGRELLDRLDANGHLTVEAIRVHGEAVVSRLTETNQTVAREFDERGDDLVFRHKFKRPTGDGSRSRTWRRGFVRLSATNEAIAADLDTRDARWSNGSPDASGAAPLETSTNTGSRLCRRSFRRIRTFRGNSTCSGRELIERLDSDGGGRGAGDPRRRRNDRFSIRRHA